MWKCGNTWSLPILISRAAYPYFLIITLLANLLFDYLDTLTIPASLLQESFRGSYPPCSWGTKVKYNKGQKAVPGFCSLIADFCGGHSKEDPPVPIPNTEVKLFCADGTARATVWESRSPPFSYTQSPGQLSCPGALVVSLDLLCSFSPINRHTLTIDRLSLILLRTPL